jgi:hypothetical protein
LNSKQDWDKSPKLGIADEQRRRIHLALACLVCGPHRSGDLGIEPVSAASASYALLLEYDFHRSAAGSSG